MPESALALDDPPEWPEGVDYVTHWSPPAPQWVTGADLTVGVDGDATVTVEVQGPEVVNTPIYDPEDNTYLGSVRQHKWLLGSGQVVLSMDSLTSAIEEASTTIADFRGSITNHIRLTTSANVAFNATNNFYKAWAAAFNGSQTIRLNGDYFQGTGWHNEWGGGAWEPWTTRAGNNYTYQVAPARSAEDVAREKRSRARAVGKARRLLKEHLTEQEHDQLATSGYFEVESLTSGRRYRIYRGYSRNVVALDETGRPVERLCAHSPGWMPDEDHMLGQKLYIESCEDEFRKTANKSRIGKVEAAQLMGEKVAATTREVIDVLPNVYLPLAA